MDSVTVASVTHAEWIKFRTVRSTIVGYVVTVVLTLGLGALITSAIRGHWQTMEPLRKLTFDPVSTSLGGTLFAQFAVGVIGIMFITSEYSSGSIRTTLAATPRRVQVVVAKLIVLVSVTAVVAEVVVFAAFLMGQRIYEGVVPTASLASGAVLRSVILGGVYLTLLATLGFGLGLLLRQQSAAISVFTSLLLIVPIIVFVLPQSWQTSVTRYEPSSLGHAMMSVTPSLDMFGAWTATLVLASYVVCVVVLSTATLVRRDA